MNADSILKGWRDILWEYRKLNASVLASPIVERAEENYIKYERSTKIYFGVEGRPVPVYKLFITSQYATLGCVSLASQATPNDGLVLNSPTRVYEFPAVKISEIYLHPHREIPGVLPGIGVPINRSIPTAADPAFGSIYILGFTTPITARDDA